MLLHATHGARVIHALQSMDTVAQLVALYAPWNINITLLSVFPRPKLRVTTEKFIQTPPLMYTSLTMVVRLHSYIL